MIRKPSAVLLLSCCQGIIKSNYGYQSKGILSKQLRNLTTNPTQTISSATTDSGSLPFPGCKGQFTTKLDIHNPDVDKGIPIYRVLDNQGQVLDHDEDPQISNEMAIKMYRTMHELNSMDRVLEAAQRQGRITFYAANYGEEALQVGSAAGLDDKDLIFAQYREVGALFWRGFTVSDCVHQCFGTKQDMSKGRQLPIHYGSKKHNYVTISSTLSTQIPQAPGAAYAFKRKGNGLCVMCYFGEGSASMGDTHAAFNFAAVLQCPVIFFCRNNGYAISTSTQEQFKGDGIASRGAGYGMMSVRVDGNDPLAVYNVTRKAREIAVQQNRPVLIEAMTYRVGDHSTSDESSRYRSQDEVNQWKKNMNPMDRFRKYLENRSIWDEDKERELMDETNKIVMDAISEALKEPKPNPKHLFTDVYDEMPDNLKRQRDALKQHVSTYKEQFPLEEFEAWR